MPLYEYKCPECGLRFEQLVPFFKKDKTDCPDCGVTAEVLMSKSHFNNYPVRSVKLNGNDVV